MALLEPRWRPAGWHLQQTPFRPALLYGKCGRKRNICGPRKLDANLPEGYLPANHAGGAPVPTMGKHYIDVTCPEFNRQPFSQTFIFGSYAAKLTFLEPMITLDFLKQTNNFVRSIPQPAKFQKTGYYPTKMRVSKVNGVTNIILKDFVLRQAS